MLGGGWLGAIPKTRQGPELVWVLQSTASPPENKEQNTPHLSFLSVLKWCWRILRAFLVFSVRLQQPGGCSRPLAPNWRQYNNATLDPGPVRRAKQNVRSISSTEKHVEKLREHELPLKLQVW